jgi:hypothetical protein
VEKGLTQLKRNDEMLDVQLEEISKVTLSHTHTHTQLIIMMIISNIILN